VDRSRVARLRAGEMPFFEPDAAADSGAQLHPGNEGAGLRPRRSPMRPYSSTLADLT
jgi:hypothetical protein